MGRPRRWQSDAERMAYARDKAAYVERMAREARVDAEDRVAKRNLGIDRDEELSEIDVEARVNRARDYAAWRWDGFHTKDSAGNREIASL